MIVLPSLPAPLSKEDAARFIRRRHPEWIEFNRTWRWLLDSFEGGDRYRFADYSVGPLGCDWGGDDFSFANTIVGASAPNGQVTVSGTSPLYGDSIYAAMARNLVQHASEMDPESGQKIYGFRLACTPITEFVAESVESFLGRIYCREVQRSGSPELKLFWADPDGAGKDVDHWMRKKIAPLLIVLGQIDIVFTHPPAPSGVVVQTRADAERFGTARVLADYILPENIPWWRLEPVTGRYAELIVFERHDDGPVFRHWNTIDSIAYDADGDYRRDLSFRHGLGRVPIVRLFDKRVLRLRNVGKSRVLSIAEHQKAAFNLESEQVLADAFAAHSLLQVPPGLDQAQAEVKVGPGGMLPAGKLNGAVVDWKYVTPPPSTQESRERHLGRIADAVDRASFRVKPAGASSTGPTTMQSGIAKAIDHSEGAKVLSEIAETLADVERVVAEYALWLAAGGPPDADALESIAIEYPREFQFDDPADLALSIQILQQLAGAAGLLPEAETDLLQKLIATLLPGVEPDRRDELLDEVKSYVASRARQRDADHEAEADYGGGAADVDPTDALVVGGVYVNPPTNEQQSLANDF